VRDLFKNAEEEWKRKREKSAMHVIIIDEIDALCRHRGGGGGAGSGGGDSGGGGGAHRDAVVNQLLSKIDGLDQFDAGGSDGSGAGGANQNVLVIGTTNRKDMIDDAVLRPGRLEIHVRNYLVSQSVSQSVRRKEGRNFNFLVGSLSDACYCCCCCCWPTTADLSDERTPIN
jgi:SpoVK/Ycf46/Vps4 family AAA+-type ATPase